MKIKHSTNLFSRLSTFWLKQLLKSFAVKNKNGKENLNG
jgi:hypothetical protein